MITSKLVREARKTAQLERLSRKGDKDYPEFYANQPQQLIKAQNNEKIRLAKIEVLKTSEELQVAEISGFGLSSAQKKETVSKLVLMKHLETQKPNSQINLLSAGGS